MGKGSQRGGGYDYRQHTHASDDPETQNACRDICEGVLRGAPGTHKDVEAWGREKNTYKRYCQQYGLSFEKTGRGWFRIQKLDPTEGNPFADMVTVLEELSPSEPMNTRELLFHVKNNCPDLWRRLSVKGVNNCSERKLHFVEDEVKRYFDVSHDWQMIAAKGKLNGCIEYAKPLLLNGDAHGHFVQQALSSVQMALGAVPWRRNDNAKNGKELFCVFNESSSQNKIQRVLDQRESQEYAKMLLARARLPAYRMKDEMLEKFEEADVLVVCGATGCGKTTQLPQLLMELLAERGDDSRIICTQPRRISATSVAERVSHERGEKIGGSVGYQIRFEHKASKDTCLLYCTVGILLRHLTSNPTLEGVGVVVLDEVHERDVHGDFALLILRDLVRGPRRGDLKLVLMSATIDAQGFIDYFQGPDQEGTAPDLAVQYFEIPGKTNYPIQEFWIEDILESMVPHFTPAGPPPPKKYSAPVKERNMWATEPGAVSQALEGKYSQSTCDRLVNVLRRPAGKIDFALIGEIVLHIAKNRGPGAILIFVPGWQDIADCIKQLQARASQVSSQETWRTFPLHSMVPPHEQRQIFRVLPEGERKIIVSTNIAETSITVEDIVFVIDAGAIKGTTYTPRTNVATLEAFQISRSNAQQRRGRAGRCQPGQFYKLYSSLEWQEMPDSMPPEMQRTPVEELCLQVKALELPGLIEDVLGKAIDPPAPRAISNALFLLRSLGALSDDQHLTPLGWKLALLPLHPSLGKMILLGSLFDCVPELLSVCGTLSSKSPFVLPFGKEKEADAAKKRLGEGLPGDHVLYAKVVAMWHRLNGGARTQFVMQSFLSDKTLQQIEKTRQDLHKYVVDLKLRPPGETLRPGDSDMRMDKCAELLCVLASSLPLATRPPSQRKFKCLEAAHAACAVHPSSLIEQLSSPKRKKRDSGETYTVLSWFSRLKTAELYLHDASVITDPLPLVLLSPYVALRASEPGVFEISAPSPDDDIDNDEVEAGDEEELGVPPPPLLARLSDPNLAPQVWNLRQKLNELVDRIVGQPPMRLPPEVQTAFQDLRALVNASYQLHADDWESCEAFGETADNGEASTQRGGKRARGKAAGGGGKGGGGGYPWWQHIKGKGRGKGKGGKGEGWYA